MSIKSAGLLMLQFLTMGYLVFSYNMPKTALAIGIQILAVAIALWGILAGGIHSFNAQPEVKSETLITKGPFKWIRNPMYLGIILFFGIDIISNFSGIRGMAFFILVITLLLKIFSEEKFLKEKFGDSYLAYKAKSFRLIPFLY